MYKIGPRFLLGLSLGIFTLAGLSGCHRGTNAAEDSVVANNSGPDPADANMAPVDNSQTQSAAAPAAQGAVLGFRSQSQPQQDTEQYTSGPQEPAPQQAAPPPPSGQDQAFQDAQTAEQLDAD